MNTLTNNQEKLIRALYTRVGRKKHNLCICEGLRACKELVKARPDLISFAVKSEETELPAEFVDLEFIIVPEEKIKQISSTVTTQGILIVAERPEVRSPDSVARKKKSEEVAENPTNSDYRPPVTDNRFSVILDGVADPGNMGTIIRTAKAAGLKELFLTSGCADPYADKVIRSAMAAQFSINIYKFANLAETICELRKSGVENFWKTDPHKGNSLFETEDLFANSAINSAICSGV
jgi:TrmH family RNA methyltransferase